MQLTLCQSKWTLNTATYNLPFFRIRPLKGFEMKIPQTIPPCYRTVFLITLKAMPANVNIWFRVKFKKAIYTQMCLQMKYNLKKYMTILLLPILTYNYKKSIKPINNIQILTSVQERMWLFILITTKFQILQLHIKVMLCVTKNLKNIPNNQFSVLTFATIAGTAQLCVLNLIKKS